MRRVWVTSPAYEAAVSQLVAVRKRCGLSQRDLAERINKPRSFISKIENRERRIDIVEFIVLARALGLDPNDLLAELAGSLPNQIDI
ncbi:helix-turn-helix domain-containing protein [Brevundimonas sp.]|uniref:helix-turn-helix domain-containing protein n=1 Tax=Brevundimonas sp. TaxID=1871086 RepID=UPI003F713C9F